MHNNIKEGLKDGIPIALGYFSVSFTFGMLAVNSGMAPLHAVLISLLNLTSSKLKNCTYVHFSIVSHCHKDSPPFISCFSLYFIYYAIPK